MKKILLKTKTSIATHITSGGLKISVISPEIGELIKGGDHIVQRFWDNREEIEQISGSDGASMEDMVKYFLSPSEEYKKAIYQKIVHKNFWVNTFHFIKKKYIGNSSILPHDLTITTDNFIFHRGTINLACLTNPRIEQGENFLYKGIYNRELVSQNIAPLLRMYAAGVIRVFGLNKVAEYPENKNN